MQSTLRQILLPLLICTVMFVGLTGCELVSDLFPPEEPTKLEFAFSFEEGMQGWEADGTDLDDPPVEWSVERSEQIARDGATSVQLLLDNVNDAGKIWMERAFEVEPNQRYEVSVEYAFASGDWGDINLWTIIAGVHPTSPESADDLTFQGDTGNQAQPEDGFVWLDKSYDFIVTSNAEGRIYVALGVWGTWETQRVYFIDDVRVTLSSAP